MVEYTQSSSRIEPSREAPNIHLQLIPGQPLTELYYSSRTFHSHFPRPFQRHWMWQHQAESWESQILDGGELLWKCRSIRVLFGLKEAIKAPLQLLCSLQLQMRRWRARRWFRPRRVANGFSITSPWYPIRLRRMSITHSPLLMMHRWVSRNIWIWPSFSNLARAQCLAYTNRSLRALIGLLTSI